MQKQEVVNTKNVDNCVDKVWITEKEVQEMLKKIYEELVLIRKELQAIRSSKESKRRKEERFKRPNAKLGK